MAQRGAMPQTFFAGTANIRKNLEKHIHLAGKMTFYNTFWALSGQNLFIQSHLMAHTPMRYRHMPSLVFVGKSFSKIRPKSIVKIRKRR
jgi:hypothetical protein